VRIPLYLLAALGTLQGVALPPAQQPAQTFQFISIRPVPGVCPQLILCLGAGSKLPSSVPHSISVLPGGRFEARNQSFENLARLAFGFEGVDPRNGVVSMPRLAWIEQDRFDVTAITDREWSVPPAGDLVPAELRVMLRALLEQRFQMKARLHTRKMDVYAVRLSNQEPGAGLRRSNGECLGPYTDPQPEDDRPACPFRLEVNLVEAGAVTMIEVARIISRIQGLNADRPVIDDTGLLGTYDLRLSIDRIVSGERRPIAIRDELRRQLGLKLENAKLPIPTLVIDRAKKPEED
jgi:uncharacterized protein (TIGR03435 family)